MVVEAEVIYKLASSGVDSTWFYLPLMSDLKRMVVVTLISAQSSFFNYSHLALIRPSIRLGVRGRLGSFNRVGLLVPSKLCVCFTKRDKRGALRLGRYHYTFKTAP